jgi:hypothetical protein
MTAREDKPGEEGFETSGEVSNIHGDVNIGGDTFTIEHQGESAVTVGSGRDLERPSIVENEARRSNVPVLIGAVFILLTLVVLIYLIVR